VGKYWTVIDDARVKGIPVTGIAQKLGAVLCFAAAAARIIFPGDAHAEEVSADALVRGLESLRDDSTRTNALIERLTGDQAEPSGLPVEALLKLLEALPPEPTISAPDAAIDPQAVEFFERSVRPVLAEHCFSCHGPEKQKNELRVDSRAALLQGGAGGAAINPGDAAGSLLIQVIAYTGDIQMPPTQKLPQEAIDALTHWVAMGAPWPGGDQTASANLQTMDSRIADARASHWAFQPVQNAPVPAVTNTGWSDAALDRFILKKLEEAGLSPSPRADKRTLIRRATFGLHGLPPTPEEVESFEADESPEAYARLIDRLLASPRYGERWGRYWLDVARYADTRGYVFQQEREFAFSYTYRDYVIRAFNEDVPYDQFIMHQLAADRMDLGEDKRPLAALGFLTLGRHFLGNIHDITDDRIDVVTRGLQALTVSCARCHDHKYDPIPSSDYYSMYGIFRSSYEPDEPPRIEEPDPEDPQYQDYVKEVAAKEQAVQDYLTSLHLELLTHARERVGDYLLAAWEAREMDDEPLRALARDNDLHWQLVQQWRDYLKKKAEAHDPVFAPWTAFTALAPEAFETEAPALATRFAASESTEPPINPRVAEAFNGAAPTSMAEVAERYGRVLKKTGEEWAELLAGRAQIAQQDGTPELSLPPGLPDPNAEALRLVLYVDSPASIPAGQVEDLRDVPTRNRIRDLRNAVARVKATHPGRPDCAMAMYDAENPFAPYVFERGKPDNKGEEVPRQYLAIFATDERKPFDNGSGRLELAQAIANRDNPLTARVMVNRVWMYHFGKPLVASPSDFGVQSDPPTHPDLLDHLAWQFMENGWSVKWLHRAMMLSEAYQQESFDRPDGHAADPENRLLWRQNRRRLDFEAMRDAVLAAAGHIDLTMGGPSVEITAKPFPLRRTVYSHIERQNLPGMFRTFDFAGPDAHSPRRYFTTVPQQALFLMNSRFIIEQARALMTRPELGGDLSDEQRIAELYELTQQRAPESGEVEMGLAFLARTAESGPPPPPPAPTWEYGCGRVDEAAGKVTGFAVLPHFSDNAWKGGPSLPDPALGWVSLNSHGGHPGDDNHAAIRRWIAPLDAVVAIEGHLRHGSEQGNGVLGYIVSSRTGIVWSGSVHNGEIETDARDITVRSGDTLDLVVACQGDTGFDGFTWHPRIWVTKTSDEATFIREWLSRLDFEGPAPAMPEPLKPWEQYAQVLLLTNEFMFVD
jgi:mono/diheme cytochrome c family protein